MSSPISGNTNDWRLFTAEMRASRAYLDTLVEAGALEPDDSEKLRTALEQIEKERKSYALAGLDMFRVIDTRMESLVGKLVYRFGAGRGVHERLLTALRLWLIDVMQNAGVKLAEIQRTLLTKAEGTVAALMPAYADQRPVQTVSCAHWLLSFFWMLARDQDRLANSIGRTSLSPMGSGLLAGSPYPIDRERLAQNIDFTDISRNSMDAVSDWDFAAECLFTANMIGMHLSRLTQDLMIFSNPTVAFITFEGEFPIALSKARGQSATLFGQLAGFIATLKALPSVYNADAPQNRQMLYDAADALTDLLNGVASIVSVLNIQADRMWEALDEGLFTTDVVEYLNARGVSGADQIVRNLQAKAEQSGIPISEIPLADFKAASDAFADDVFTLFDYTRSVARRTAPGGTSPAAVRVQIRQAATWLVDAGFE